MINFHNLSTIYPHNRAFEVARAGGEASEGSGGRGISWDY